MIMIRTAALADVPGMHEVRLAVLENRLTNPARITEASYLPFIEAGSAWVAMYHDEEIIGFSALDPAAQIVWALFVHPDQEGAGIGRALHDAMLAWARDQGIHAVHLFTAAGTRAEQFYIKAGWNRKDTSSGETRFERILDN
jgi:GNAT superfamily N-acetyltransferase